MNVADMERLQRASRVTCFLFICVIAPLQVSSFPRFQFGRQSTIPYIHFSDTFNLFFEGEDFFSPQEL